MMRRFPRRRVKFVSLYGVIAFACLFFGIPVRAGAQAPAVVPAPPASATPVDSSRTPAPSGHIFRDPKTLIEFVRIPGGEFHMGSDGFPDEGPIHRVRIGDFWLAKTEVTQAQWQSVMGSNPTKRLGCDDCPVGQVSWEDVQKFLLKTAYRLPTEAEWEYAAGGGAKHQRWAGTDNESELGEFAWFRGNSANQPHPVGEKKPNLFGLYDMSGNVYEWCADWYDADFYKKSPADDPAGPSSGSYRVARGGSWILDPRIAGVTFRLRCQPSRRRNYLGFRPALTSAPE